MQGRYYESPRFQETFSLGANANQVYDLTKHRDGTLEKYGKFSEIVVQNPSSVAVSLKLDSFDSITIQAGTIIRIDDTPFNRIEVTNLSSTNATDKDIVIQYKRNVSTNNVLVELGKIYKIFERNKANPDNLGAIGIVPR